jgi:hypothetical protein
MGYLKATRPLDHETTDLLSARAFRIIALIGAIATLLLIGFTLLGGDLTPGYVFVPSEKNVTSTKLNGLVNAAVINPTFYTDKAVVTAPAGGDYLLLYNQAALDLRRVTVANLMTGFVPTITNLTQKTSPANGDLLWLWDTVNATNKSITVATLRQEPAIFTNAWTTTGVVLSNQHGCPLFLGTATNALPPSYVRCVLVCLTNDVGFAAGTEVGAEAFQYGSQYYYPPSTYVQAWGQNFVCYADATNVQVSAYKTNSVVAITGGTNVNALNWAIKVYVKP